MPAAWPRQLEPARAPAASNEAPAGRALGAQGRRARLCRSAPRRSAATRLRAQVSRAQPQHPPANPVALRLLLVPTSHHHYHQAAGAEAAAASGDKAVFDLSQGAPLGLRGLDVAVKSMKTGERAQLKLTPECEPEPGGCVWGGYLGGGSKGGGLFGRATAEDQAGV